MCKEVEQRARLVRSEETVTHCSQKIAPYKGMACHRPAVAPYFALLEAADRVRVLDDMSRACRNPQKERRLLARRYFPRGTTMSTAHKGSDA